jgi:hypothetical protein
MSASGWHWQPLINGYSDHIPPEFRDLAPRMHGFPSMESFVELRAPARYVVMHLNLRALRSPAHAERLRAYGAYLTLLNDDGDIRLYESPHGLNDELGPGRARGHDEAPDLPQGRRLHRIGHP